MEKIRKVCASLCLVLVSMLWAGCTGKAPEYSDLEGYWKTERIVDNATGEDMPCNRLFWALQLQIVELRDLGNNGFGTFIGQYAYDEKGRTLRLYNLVNKSNQKQDAEEGKLSRFGVDGSDTTFEVVSLGDGRMALRSEKNTLYFRSF